MNVLITAASSDIGESLTKFLLKDESNNVVCISRSESMELKSLHNTGKINYRSGIDLVDFDYSAIKDLISLFKGPFHLVHCAGDYWYHDPFFDIKTEVAIRMMNSHYATFYNTLQNVLPEMIHRGGGKIVTFSCNSTRYNFPNMLPFTASKAAVDATVKCIANEFSKDGIVINALALATLKTEKNLKSKPFGDHENYLTLEQINDSVFHLLNQPNELLNGNILNCFQFSPDYFNKGYFERIKQN